MQDSASPPKILLPWGTGAGASYIRTVPVPSQIGVINGAASWTDGFVPLNSTPIAAGGVPPFGGDMNGALNQISAGVQWLQAGGSLFYDAAFSTAIGGYPAGAVIAASVYKGLLWQSVIDNNTSNPDAGGAGWIVLFRKKLYANLSLYVATIGSDTLSNGLTSGTPFATISYAGNFIINNLDLNGFTVTVVVATGTYSAGPLLNGAALGQYDYHFIIFETSGGPVTINGSGYCFYATGGASYTINGQFILNETDIAGLVNASIGADSGSRIDIAGSQLVFGTAQTSHMAAATGGIISNTSGSSYTISGNSAFHWVAFWGGVISLFIETITLTGTPNFSAVFAYARDLGVVQTSSVVFSGGATGVRYNAVTNGVINTSGGGASYLPGNVAGATFTGGQYV